MRFHHGAWMGMAAFVLQVSLPSWAQLPPAAEPKDLRELFPVGAPGMPVPLSGFTFGMTLEEVGRAVPELGKNFGTGLLKPAGFPGVEIRVMLTNPEQTLSGVVVRLPAEATGVLRNLWGEPIRAAITLSKKLDTEPADVWLNERSGLQAFLVERGAVVELTLLPLMSWRGILGKEKSKLGFEGRPLMGLPARGVLAAYAAYRPRQYREDFIALELPPYEYRAIPTEVQLYLKDGVVRRIMLDLHYLGLESMKGEMLDQICAKFGTPINGNLRASERLFATFSRDPFIQVQPDPERRRYTIDYGL